MQRAIYIVSAAFLLIAGPVSAQQATPPNISINVDRQPLVQNEPFSLTIHIESASRADPEVRLPRFGGFRVLRQSESHPMSFHFSFGLGQKKRSQTKRESNYNFVLVADKAGRHKLDPVIVTLDGRKYQGDPYVLDIVASQSSGSPSPQGQPRPQAAQPASPIDPGHAPTAPGMPSLDSAELEGAKIDPDYFIQTHVSKKNVVVGEPLVLTVYLYSATNISNLDVIREPGTEGFWVENLLPANRRLTSKPVQVAGRGYDRAALRQSVLFPIKPGKLTIAPTLVELVVSRGGFFSKRRTVKRASMPVTVEVAPLPTDKQPTGFNPANVGRYAFKATLDRNEVKAGEPVTLTLNVRGEGNLRNLVLPEVPEIDGFKVYAPESEADVNARGGTVTGSRSSRILMIPKDPGKYVIPKISWSYFDPKSQQYKTLSSRPRTVTVRPGTNHGPAPVAQGQAPTKIRAGQDRLNRQLRLILSRAHIEANGDGLTMTRPWFLILVIGIPLLYLAVLLVSRTRRRIAEGHIKGRSKRADAKAIRRLAELRKSQGNLDAETFFAELARLLMGFLEDRLEVPVAGDTMADLKRRLTKRGFSSDQAEQVVTEMESCDFARFARSANDKSERNQVLERMERLIRKLAGVRVSAPPKEGK
ncbi:MAG: protein BatD [Deltaproteobacteria bacterium]|nr:protein BatD [Deltaproteobacteria bacterium]